MAIGVAVGVAILVLKPKQGEQVTHGETHVPVGLRP